MTIRMQELAEEVLRGVQQGSDRTGVVHVWRGQGDTAWPLYPGIYRRLLAIKSAAEVTEELVRKYEIDMLCEANGFGYYTRGRLPTLVRVQHYGGATRFLDVTRDPLTALWFATDPALTSKDGAVYHFQVPLECLLAEGTMDTLDEVDEIAQREGAALLFPKPDEERVAAQRAGFLVPSIGETLAATAPFAKGAYGFDVSKVVVPGETKATLRRHLETSAGISARSLFPGVAGYAMAQSVGEPFARGEDELHDGSYGIFPGRGAPRVP
ncbi:MAG: FRG domain-containing protein [Cellulomonas sp.]|uniref:FRG domain-containing protein n=1 Tax=Cellulomonas sp. TaxID=40001 RepID=UPI00185AA2AC|nr:FRG domain-containing protein [Cellulomonas sp.]NMM31416.1 FRG domain-containing protein [Cellulomonas sp.]